MKNVHDRGDKITEKNELTRFIYFLDKIMENKCCYHQCAKNIGTGFIVKAFCNDGKIYCSSRCYYQSKEMTTEDQTVKVRPNLSLQPKEDC